MVRTMIKLSDNPPMLPAGVASPEALGGTWWVAHTKSRSEKALAWDLNRRGVDYFLPMAGRTFVSGGRWRTVLTPVFPSYVFVCDRPGAAHGEARAAVFATNRVANVIAVPQQPTLVAELANLHRAIASKLTLDPYPFAAVGRRCRVARGPLRGTEGIVVRRDDVIRLVLGITMLGQGVSLEVTADVLEPMD